MNISSIIKQLRMSYNFSHRELAKRAKVSHSMISMIENKNYLPKEQLLERIAAALNTTLENLYKGKAKIQLVKLKELKLNEEELSRCQWEKELLWCKHINKAMKEWDKHIAARVIIINEDIN